MISKEIYREEEIQFTIKDIDRKGILSFPNTEAPYPAVVLLHGSDRSAHDDPYYKEHANQLVQSGYAVLRYDGPGWGFETFDDRTEEAITIVKNLQSRPDIQAKSVGLWGISQGGWICQMAAVAYEDIAFIIPVSGPAVTPTEQEVYRVEAESRAAGFDEHEVAKAVLMRRLMADAVLAEPIYQVLNEQESTRLGDDGPWHQMMTHIYASVPSAPEIEFDVVVSSLKAIKDERWAISLHLEQVLPMLENVPPPTWDMVKAQIRSSMEVNPADFLTRVKCPVLTIFGEKDTSIPVEKSITLYKKYLTEAGNNVFTLKVFPEASHTIHVGRDFASGYFDLMVKWLKQLNSISDGA